MDVTYTGAKEIDDVLRGLPDVLTHRVLQAAFTDAAQPLVLYSKALAPRRNTGNLKESIGITKTALGKADSLGEILVGPRRGRYKGNVGPIIERGTVARTLKGNGQYRAGTNRGAVTAHPFMEPAFDNTIDVVKQNSAEAIGRKLFQFMSRTIKKYG